MSYSHEEETIEDQTRLIGLIQNEGWRVTALELKQYDAGPFNQEEDQNDVQGAEIDLTVYIDYSDDDEDADNPYQVK